MDKAQAINSFWNSFGLPAYEENSLPDKQQLPYITYETALDSINNVLTLRASLWYRSTSWEEITKKAEEIGEMIYKAYPASTEIDGGRVYITRGTPFAQRMGDVDETIKRIVLNIQVEFFTAF